VELKARHCCLTTDRATCLEVADNILVYLHRGMCKLELKVEQHVNGAAPPADKSRRISRGMTSAELWGRCSDDQPCLGEFARFGRHFTRLRDASKDRGTRGCWTTTTTMAQSTLDDWARDPVDPEIRAHVYSLISAVSHCNIALQSFMSANACAAWWYW
jgi:hypothetical protein